MIKIGNNTLYNGDCLEIMKQIPDNSIDLVLTDPPYEFNKLGGCGKSELAKSALKLKQDISFIADGYDYDKVFQEFKRICRPLNLFIFCSNLQITKIMSYFEQDYLTTLLCWHKTNAIPLVNGKYHSNLEFIVCVRNRGSYFNNNLNVADKTKIFSMSYPQGDRYHPTQKPLELIQKLLQIKSKENDTVLDCFMGSGTTGVACEQLKRNFIGIEIDRKYFDIACKRIEAEHNQLKLF